MCLKTASGIVGTGKNYTSQNFAVFRGPENKVAGYFESKYDYVST